jgi:hypothetical protein
MGADSVVVCYGLRYSLGEEADLTEIDLEAIEEGTDPRIVAAHKVGLRSYFGRVTDGGEHFLILGTVLGNYGIEGMATTSLSDAELSEMMDRTRRRLLDAGLKGEPALHVQLEAQY